MLRKCKNWGRRNRWVEDDGNDRKVWRVLEEEEGKEGSLGEEGEDAGEEEKEEEEKGSC